jgi:hypothetical protein
MEVNKGGHEDKFPPAVNDAIRGGTATLKFLPGKSVSRFVPVRRKRFAYEPLLHNKGALAIEGFVHKAKIFQYQKPLHRFLACFA